MKDKVSLMLMIFMELIKSSLQRKNHKSVKTVKDVHMEGKRGWRVYFDHRGWIFH